MKIAFVSQPMDMVVPPYQNSLGLWTYHLAPLIAQAHEVLVYAKRSKAQNAYHGQDSVQYRFIPPVIPNRLLAAALDKFRRKNALPVFASPLYPLDYIYQVARDCRQRRVDLIHLYNFTQFIPVLRRLNPRAKIVLHMTGEWLTQLDPAAIQHRLQAADLILGPSDYIVEKIRTRFPQYAARCATVYNGVLTEVFTPPAQKADTPNSRTGKLLFVGRVSPEKGVHVLVEAFRQIAAQFPETHLDIAGPLVSLPREFIVDLSHDPQTAALARIYDQGDYTAYLHSLVPDPLRDRVRLLGGMPQPDLVQHYQAADLLVNPSFSESFGMSLIEAMSCETPVIATRVGGMVEVTGNGEFGLLIEPGDPAALAAAIRELLTDEPRRRELGKKGRARVLSTFTWPQIAQSLLRLYRGLRKQESRIRN